MEYQINLKPSAQKDLDRLPSEEIKRIAIRLKQLSINSRPVGIQKLSKDEGYRIRTGKYRILFLIDDEKKIINVYRIKHRKDAYK